ncbi:hypothetical protein QUF75_20805 [Desulfococcaceae bacterium HSG7]|nr:hypothetical protein [Desulfococcaceae bacterium HSG7]
MSIATIQIRFFDNLFIRQVQSHEIKAQYPNCERLMTPGKNCTAKIIEAFCTIFTLIALSGGFFFVETSFDNLGGFTKRTLSSVRPALLPYCAIASGIINQIFYIYLHMPGSFDGLEILKFFLIPYQDPGIQHEPLGYTSKYNPIEHLMSPHVTRACQGVIFRITEIVRKLIERTETKNGLKVTAKIIDKVYELKRKVKAGLKKNMLIIFDQYMPQWNYRAIPKGEII